jgi:hypothetical protein
MQLSKNNVRSYRYTTLQTVGGGERVRTDGLLRARQALSQLSYTPDILSAEALAQADGGPGWTRTTDLTIISRVL